MMIFKQPVFYILIVLLILVAGLNFLAFQNFWYWKIAWFDLLMHFLGGLFVGLSALWLNSQFKKDDQSESSLNKFFVATSFALLIGGFWELFEFSTDQYWSAHVNLKTLQILQNGQLDSLSDLLFDVIGALTSGLFIIFLPSLIRRAKEVGKTNTEQYDQKNRI